jgi:tetratricopeptide (TPR) repeat protein
VKNIFAISIKQIHICLLIFCFAYTAKSQPWNVLSDSARLSFEKNDFELYNLYAKKAFQSIRLNKNKLDTNSIIVFNQLGESFYHLQKFDSAEYYIKSAILQFEKWDIKEHRILALLLSSYASVLEEIGEIEQIEKTYLQSLEMHRKIFPAYCKETADCLNSLGIFYRVTGKLPECEASLSESLEMYRKIYKDDNKDLASTMCNLAN